MRESALARAVGTPAARGGMLRSLRHRDYRLLWIGLGLALTGFQVGRVALGYLAYQLTGSALYLTLVFAGDSLPMLLLSPLGGVLVDRINRKTLLLVCRSLIAVLAIGVSALVVAGVAEAWHLLLFSLATGVLYAFDIPARQALIRDLVPEEDFFNAVALSSTV
jgi:MFS family permease